MKRGARTPEELETLFEDAFVIRDSDALAQLFEDGAVLVASSGSTEARGEQIARSVAAMWEDDCIYVAEAQRVLQARDTALVVAERGINVVRRGGDHRWRYAISFLDIQGTTERKDR
jgi:ketosteroid isomerase-like protein